MKCLKDLILHVEVSRWILLLHAPQRPEKGNEEMPWVESVLAGDTQYFC